MYETHSLHGLMVVFKLFLIYVTTAGFILVYMRTDNSMLFTAVWSLCAFSLDSEHFMFSLSSATKGRKFLSESKSDIKIVKWVIKHAYICKQTLPACSDNNRNNRAAPSAPTPVLTPTRVCTRLAPEQFLPFSGSLSSSPPHVGKQAFAESPLHSR